MFVLIWKFRVRAYAEKLFTEGYGAGGKWEQLFRRAAGFECTELARSVEDEHTFYTLDHWQSQEAFEKFREEYAAEYTAIDREFEGLTESSNLSDRLFGSP